MQWRMYACNRQFRELPTTFADEATPDVFGLVELRPVISTPKSRGTAIRGQSSNGRRRGPE